MDCTLSVFLGLALPKNGCDRLVSSPSPCFNIQYVIFQLREDFDCGKETTIDDEQCPHDVANLLKEFLRDLPDPLLCRELYHAFIQTQSKTITLIQKKFDDQCDFTGIRNRRLQLEAIQHLVQLLPPANRDTLYVLLSFLAHVAKNANDGKNALGKS